MKVRCEAVLELKTQRDNLCQCIRILGGEPEVNGKTVSVEYEGEAISMFESLFDQYQTHSITISA